MYGDFFIHIKSISRHRYNPAILYKIIQIVRLWDRYVMAINAFNDSYVVVYCAVLSFSIIMRSIEHDIGFRRKSPWSVIFLQSADLNIVMRNNNDIIFSPGKLLFYGRIVLLVCEIYESLSRKSIVKLSRTVMSGLDLFSKMLQPYEKFANFVNNKIFM